MIIAILKVKGDVSSKPIFPYLSKEFVEKEPSYSHKFPQTNLNM